MPELGRKLTCSECGAKFYDLGKPGALCPRCGSPPAGENETKPPPKRRPEPVAAKDDHEDDEDLPPFDANDEELTVPVGEDDEDEDIEDDLDEEVD